VKYTIKWREMPPLLCGMSPESILWSG